MKQVLKQRALMWEANVPNGGLTETEKVLRLVRRVRNNLFHGGKHNAGLFENTDRSIRLLTNSIVVIRESGYSIDSTYQGM